MESNLQVKMEITEVALIPEPHLNMDEAIAKVQELGHTILRVEGRNIIVQHKKHKEK